MLPHYLIQLSRDAATFIFNPSTWTITNHTIDIANCMRGWGLVSENGFSAGTSPTSAQDFAVKIAQMAIGGAGTKFIIADIPTGPALTKYVVLQMLFFLCYVPLNWIEKFSRTALLSMMISRICGVAPSDPYKFINDRNAVTKGRLAASFLDLLYVLITESIWVEGSPPLGHDPAVSGRRFFVTGAEGLVPGSLLGQDSSVVHTDKIEAAFRRVNLRYGRIWDWVAITGVTFTATDCTFRSMTLALISLYSRRPGFCLGHFPNLEFPTQNIPISCLSAYSFYHLGTDCKEEFLRAIPFPRYDVVVETRRWQRLGMLVSAARFIVSNLTHRTEVWTRDEALLALLKTVFSDFSPTPDLISDLLVLAKSDYRHGRKGEEITFWEKYYAKKDPFWSFLEYPSLSMQIFSEWKVLGFGLEKVWVPGQKGAAVELTREDFRKMRENFGFLEIAAFVSQNLDVYNSPSLLSTAFTLPLTVVPTGLILPSIEELDPYVPRQPKINPRVLAPDKELIYEEVAFPVTRVKGSMRPSWIETTNCRSIPFGRLFFSSEMKAINDSDLTAAEKADILPADDLIPDCFYCVIGDPSVENRYRLLTIGKYYSLRWKVEVFRELSASFGKVFVAPR
jgi:hypothetical protein